MISYKQIFSIAPDGSRSMDNSIFRSDGWQIPFAPANTDYQRFKQDIAAGAELQDADGNVMSADDAQAFVATLP